MHILFAFEDDENRVDDPRGEDRGEDAGALRERKPRGTVFAIPAGWIPKFVLQRVCIRRDGLRAY